MGLFFLQKAKLITISECFQKWPFKKLIQVQMFFYRHSEWTELDINFLKRVLCNFICNRGSPLCDSVSMT